MKIMTWNIKELTYDKLFSAHNNLQLEHILHNIFPQGLPLGDEFPDIIVIQEVMYSPLVNGHSQYPNVARGVLGNDMRYMANLIFWLIIRLYLRSNPAVNWFAVPPLSLSYHYGYGPFRIAVLFNSEVLDFYGPNVYTAAGSARPTARVEAADYPDPFNRMLPNREVTLLIGDDDARNFSQRNLAGRVLPLENFAFRWPWVTRFRERNGEQRFITVIACHAPSSLNFPAAPRIFVQNLSNAINQPVLLPRPIANEVQVLLGDFNVNGYEASWSNPNQTVFQSLITAGFTSLFNIINLNEQNIDANVGQSPTMLRDTEFIRQRVPSINNTSYLDPLWPDNIFTRYGQRFEPRPRILNRIIGTPRTDIARGNGYGVDMENSILDLVLAAASLDPPAAQDAFICNRFLTPKNYGHIRGTSDHMALILDIF